MVLLLRAHVDAIFRFRSFVVGSVQRDFAGRYRNSILGAAWLLLQPLSQIVVFTVIFSQVMRARLGGSDSPLAYSINLCAGMLTWMLFAEITGRSTTVFVDHANLIKKLNFPRICLPIIVIANACIGFAIIFAIFTVFLLLTDNFPGWRFVLLLPVLGVEVLLAIGLGIVLGVLNVFFRDVGQAFAIVLQFWFWLTPIVYPVESLPDWAARIVSWNPMAVLVTAYQGILVYNRSPDWSGIGAVALGAILLCGASLRLFQRRSAEMVDEL
jgi:lipopolysaccharide transport system permease protein